MVDRLAGCFTKLARAGAHLEALKAAIADLFGSEPDRVWGEFDLAAGEYVFRAQRRLAVPLEWSAMVGDVVHNLHAALDYLAWELVTANGQQGTPRTAFPIFQDRAVYAKAAERRLEGAAHDARTAIERLQPFQVPPSRGHPSDHPLSRLYELEQRDKHRSLNLVTHVVDVKLHGLLASVNQLPAPVPLPVTSHEIGDVLARVRGFERWPDMPLRITGRHRIAFAKDGPCPHADVIETLDEIRRHIETVVIPPFRRFL